MITSSNNRVTRMASGPPREGGLGTDAGWVTKKAYISRLQTVAEVPPHVLWALPLAGLR